MSQPYKSGRQQNLNLGITSVTENRTVLQTIGKVGIGTTNAQNHSLFVVGTTNITGDINVGGASTFVGVGTFGDDLYVANQLYVGGVNIVGGATIGEDVVTRNILASGISTFNGNVDANGDLDVDGQTELDNLNVSGIATIQNLDVQGNFDVYDTTATFHNNLYVAGNLSIGGTTTVIQAQDLRVFDKDIILGITTDAFGNDISTDTTANHGGIAVASTEGSPLVDLSLLGFSDLPSTYKQLMWVAANSYGVGTTDAWHFNYAVGIGSTQVQNGVRLAVVNTQITDDTIITPNINVSNNLNVVGIVTLASNGGITTTGGDLFVGGDLYVNDDIFFDEFNARNAVLSGNLSVAGVSTFTGLIDANGGLDVTGHSELDNLNVSGVSTFAGLIDANGGATIDNIRIGVAGDNEIDTSTGNLTLDSAGGTVTIDDQLTVTGTSIFQSSVYLGDSINLYIGNGNDLRFYHDGLDSYIVDQGTGNLNIYGDNDVAIKNTAGTEYKARFVTNGAVELYYDNSKKFETIGVGATVTGTLFTDQLSVSGVSTFKGNSRFESNVFLGDGDTLNFGDSNDLQIYHTTAGSGINYIRDYSSELRITANTFSVFSANLFDKFIGATYNGSVDLYYDGVKRLETTGYGVTVYNTLQAPQLNISGIASVGTAITMYASSGIVSATAFYGDGANLANTGSTLSAAAGTQRVVLTSLTSGTMVTSSTDGDLTFNASSNLLSTPNIAISGGISTDGIDTGGPQYILRADGSGSWEWAEVPGIFSVNNILNGFIVKEEGVVVGTAGSITTIDFRGNNITASADPQPNGIATVTMSDTPTFDSLTVTGDSSLGFTTITSDLYVAGVSTFVGNVNVGETLSSNQLSIVGVSTLSTINAVDATFTGNVTIGGTLTYEDVTNIDAIGVVTARSDVQVGGNLSVVGITTLASAGGITTTGGDLFVGGNLFVDGNLVYNEATAVNLSISGITTFSGPISAGGTTGTDGQYLQSTGVGVTWASFPTLRTTQTNVATDGQITFNFSYNVNFLDVFINGIKLTSSEYTASNGTQIILASPAFGGDIVEFHSYNTTSVGGGGGGGVSEAYVGLATAGLASETYVGLATAGLASESYVGLATAGLASESYVGLATAGLASEAFVGLATAGLASESYVGLATAGLLGENGDGSNLTGIVTSITAGNGISINQSTGNVTITSNVIGGYFVQTDAGIHTTSNVGLGTTNPRTPLQVERYGVDTTLGSWTASAGVPQQIDSISTDFQTAEYTLHFTNSNGIQAQKVLVMHDGTTAYSQEYGIMYSSNLLVSVSSSISGGNLTLIATPESGISGITTYRFTRQSML